MLNARYKNRRPISRAQATAPLGRPGARIGNYMSEDTTVNDRAYASAQIEKHGLPGASLSFANTTMKGLHPLTNKEMNSQLYSYERSVKAYFDEIEPTLKQVLFLQSDNDFETRAKQLISEQLGFDIPSALLSDFRAKKIDMGRLYAWCLFETYKQYCNSFLSDFPCGTNHDDFQSFLQGCGIHTFDISPCADGRLAHVISYVLRLPYRSVRRKSYAGAMFDIEDSLDKWVETEMIRFREGGADIIKGSSSRYLKAVVYHYSSRDPDNEGCAAHGSNAALAAESGMERLKAFKQAVENTYCCGASIEQLLIGLDTDTDVIRIHVPNELNDIELDNFIDAKEVFNATQAMEKDVAKNWILDFVEARTLQDGMVKLIGSLLINNLSQIDYVNSYHGGCYEDIGHAERFIGAGIGFEEVQLRNLTYFAYLNTVEEAANDLDVGIKIFTKLNISRGLPVPVVVRYDYHGNVPGARERAIEHCQRVSNALSNRYKDLESQGLLHTLMVMKDVNKTTPIEILGCSITMQATQEAH
jgi:carboxysome shell carbonic anhydrase